MRRIIKNWLNSTASLSLVLSTLIFLAALFALKLDIDEHYAKERELASGHETHEDKEPRVFGIGAEGWTAIFTGGLFVFTMALAGFTYRLFQVTKSGIADQAKSTRQSLKHAEASAKAAVGALHSDRAWMTYHKCERSFPLRTDPDGVNRRVGRLQIHWSNSGGTPAMSPIVYIYFTYRPFNEKTVPAFDMQMDENMQRGFPVGPNRVLESGIVIVEPHVLDEFRNGKIRIYLYSKIKYKTVREVNVDKFSEVCGEICLEREEFGDTGSTIYTFFRDSGPKNNST